MARSVGRAIAVTATIAWLFAVTISYYVVHKPFTIENALAVLNVVLDCLTAGIIFLTAAVVGRRMTARLTFHSTIEALVVRTGLGLGILSFATLGLGIVGILQRLAFWLLLLLVLFLLRSDLIANWHDLRLVRLATESRSERFLALVILLSLVVALFFALTPPVAWDSQTYHLVEGQWALTHGRIVPPPDIVYFSFPSLVEMLFLAAMTLRGDIAAQLIHFGYLVLTLGLILALCMRYLKLQTGWVACAIFVAIPSILAISTWAYVDIALTFYVSLALYAALVGLETEEAGWIVLAGAFSGMAMGVKYTAALVPLVLAVMILWRTKASRWKTLWLYIAVSGIVASPWYLRNLLFTGNPVYPFVFGGPNWDDFRTQWFGQFGTGLLNRPWELLLVPWHATIQGQEGTLGYQATIGPLLLALLPLLLLTGVVGRTESKLPTLRWMSVYAAAFFVYWLVGIALSSALMQTRLLFPVFPVLAIAAAVALERLSTLDFPRLSIERFAHLVVLLVVTMTCASYLLSLAESGTLSYLAGAESREQYLARNLGGYGRVVAFINTTLPESARVLGLWEPRLYYVRRPMQPDPILDLWGHQLSQSRDLSTVAQEWRKAGYTHVLLNRQGLNLLLDTHTTPTTVEDVQLLEQMLSKYGRVVYGPPLELANAGITMSEEAPYAIYALEWQ